MGDSFWREGLARFFLKPKRFRSIIWTRLKRNLPANASPLSLWNQFIGSGAFGFRRRIIFGQHSLCASVTERSSCWMRCRLVCIVRGPFLAAHRFGVDSRYGRAGESDERRTGSGERGADDGRDLRFGLRIVTASDYPYLNFQRENGLAMRAALATLDVLEAEKLNLRAIEAGERLRTRLQEALGGYEMVKAVRGEGLLLGVEFSAPRSLRLRIPFEAFMRIHPAMFGQIVVMRLFRDSGILTQVCGNNFMVLKVAPPLVVTDGQIDEFVSAIEEVVELAHSSNSFWSEALGLARRAIHV